MAGLAYAGYVLALVGGILIIVFSLLSIIGSPFLAFSPIGVAGVFATGVLGLIIGIVCVIGAKYVRSLGWAIVLLILGIIAGGLGGLLVILGAIIGIIAKLTRE